MRNLLYILCAGIILSTGACNKYPNLTQAERKAIGQYKFEKVTKHKDFLSSENVTQDYNNMILQLNDQKEAALIDQNNNVTYFGKYDVVTQRTSTGTDDDGNTNYTSNHTIIIDIKSPGRGSNFHWVGEDANITNNKIRFTAHRSDGKYKFRLDKI
ncbi:MAG: hypothetical protein KDC07_02170 [Chitinophagaceae bacterium]|nr:hypothetical protein [Chitinophagaceae bacterium]MCB9046053.1 hypothetical protein [Chitinophagales bacterium]